MSQTANPRIEPSPRSTTGTGSEIDLTRVEDESGGSALHRLRAQVADGLEQRADEVEGDVWAAIRRRVPAYEALAHDPTTADEVRASVGAVVHVFIDLVREARSFSEDEFAFMREVGARRAEQGLSVDDLHRAAHVALKVGLRHLRAEMKALGITESTFDAAGEIAESLHDYANDFTSAAGSGVRGVEERRASDRADERAEVIGQILDGALGDDSAIRDATAGVGHRLDGPCTLLVAAPVRLDGPPSLAGPMSTLLQGHGPLLRGPIRSVPIPHGAVIAPHDGHGSAGALLRKVKEVAMASGLVVVAERIVALSELSPTYRWMCDLLRVPVESRPPGIVEIDDLAPHWLVGATPAGSDFLFAKRIAGPILAGDATTRERVLPTVHAYFDAGGSVKDTAEALGIDRRTVERHLAEFEELTGRSLRDPRQQLLVQHALHLLAMRAATFPDPGDVAWSREPPP